MAYEKNNPVPIGVPGAPFATMIRNDEEHNGRVIPTYELGVLEDSENPMVVWSALTAAEVWGKLMRGMPHRNMLPAFEFIIKHMDPEQNNRVVNLVSNPGVGKSYLAILAGKLRDPRGPIVTDAGGKNLEYLLFQTVFDTEESRSLTQTLDKGLAEGTLDDLSVSTLRKFGKHFSEQDGRKCVDWKGLSEDETIPPEKIRELLNLVSTNERLDSKTMGIGFKTKKGPLVIAHEEGRDIVIDELNKCKPGTEAPLQIVWQVLNGETAEHTVTLGSSNEKFTFKRGEPGVVICTGNLPKDGQATHLISESFDRRVPSFRIPDFSPEDWQDRTSQMLTSLSIPMLHRLEKGKWEPVDPKSPSGEKEWKLDQPEEFTKLLFAFSTLGMTDEEKRKVKNWQMSEVANWPNVLTVSKKLGDFYHKWSQLVDPESPLLKSGAKFSDILLEVDNADNPTPKVTPSTMIRHIEEALVIGPQKKPANKSGGFALQGNWNTPVIGNIPEKDPVEVNFGTRLASVIMDEVYRVSAQVGKPLLYKQLTNDAKEAGLIGNPPPIAELLNVDPTKIQGSTAQAKSAQGTHAALLRSLYPDLHLSTTDEDILPLRQVQAALQQLAQETRQNDISPLTTALHVPNTDLETIEGKLFKRVAADNIEEGEGLSGMAERLPVGSLTKKTTLLSSLALPILGAENIKSLWNKAFTEGSFITDEATAIAQNQSPSGLAITTVLCRTDGDADVKYAKLHVLQNAKLGRTLVIGDDAIPDGLYNQLKRNKIIYINQSHASAEGRISSEVGLIDKTSQDILKEAFLIRNQLPPDSDKSALSLTKLLADAKQSKLVIPNCITSLDPEQVTHTARVVDNEKRTSILGGLTGR